MKDKNRDLDDVLREERSRGRRRRVDIEGERQQKEREQAVLEVFRHGTEQQWRLLGFGEEAIAEKVKAFRAARAQL
jgi:hypothetical protein